MTKTRTALIALTLAFLSMFAVTAQANACQPRKAALTYTQRLHIMAANVRAHGKPCEVEDASEGPLPCYWNARKAGNGIGQSFVALNGGIVDAYQRVIYVYDSGTIVRGGWTL